MAVVAKESIPDSNIPLKETWCVLCGAVVLVFDVNPFVSSTFVLLLLKNVKPEAPCKISSTRLW